MKLDSETALAKIKVLIAQYYENMGRGDSISRFGGEENLIEDIDEVVSSVDLDMRKVIMERLDLDNLKGGYRK